MSICFCMLPFLPQIIGRLAANLSVILQGKDKPVFAPNKDVGDICVVVNAEQAVFTGNKWEGKLYRWHTGVRHTTAGSSRISSMLPSCITGPMKLMPVVQ
jgi:ribosomal protein L13